MTEEAGLVDRQLLDRFRDLLRWSIINSPDERKRTKNANRDFMLRELVDFIDKDGRAKQWLRARCLESVVASAGLDDYLSALLGFRESSPSRTAPLNLMFASSQIARALDPIAVRMLGGLQRRSNLNVSKEKLGALSIILNPRLDFSIVKNDVYFDVDEVEQSRNLLLEFALDRFYSISPSEKERVNSSPILRLIGEAPEVTLEKLLWASKQNPSLRITFRGGVLQWKYRMEPTIFVIRDLCYYDQAEVDSKKAAYDLARRQFQLMKKALSAKKQESDESIESQKSVPNA